MTLHIVDAVEKKFEEKNEDKKLPDSYKAKAREMERALESFSSAAKHLFEIRDIDLSDIKNDVEEEVRRALR